MMNNPVANPMQFLQQLKQNPVQFLLQRRMNIPANIANDPQAILNHLLQTGQVTQDAVNRAYQQIGQFRGQK
jgi:hypothetical protein